MKVEFIEDDDNLHVLETFKAWQHVIKHAFEPLSLPIYDEQLRQVLLSNGVDPDMIKLVSMEVNDLLKEAQITSTCTFTYENLKDAKVDERDTSHLTLDEQKVLHNALRRSVKIID